ncbi:MAG: tryptophan--tRNA ligase [Eubacteriales bacterium]|nr:tryptophan--tRNA ligase [Eubacteriales bacterium]
MNTKDIVLTGDRPTGRLHIGHYTGSIVNRLKMQHEYQTTYVMIADYQAYTDHSSNRELVKESIIQLMIDYLACGLDPELNTIFIQSLVPELCEFTMIYANCVTLARLRRNPTVKNEMQQKGYGDAVPVGFLTYPISQAADITAFKANLVPAGEDQLAMLEQCNEIVRHIRHNYNSDVLQECKPILSRVTRLPGTDGQAKMGKSLGNCIYLSDSADLVREKVMGMFTDPNHLRVEDPGKVEGNPVFTYLDAFEPDREQLAEWKAWYQRGGLGDVKVKRRLVEVLNGILEPIRQKRAELEKSEDELWEILFTHSARARAVAQETLRELKSDLGLIYKQNAQK